jgi:hypothetical protein
VQTARTRSAGWQAAKAWNVGGVCSAALNFARLRRGGSESAFCRTARRCSHACGVLHLPRLQLVRPSAALSPHGVRHPSSPMAGRMQLVALLAGRIQGVLSPAAHPRPHRPGKQVQTLQG